MSVIGQIYDPLGYLAPVTVTFKIEVCKLKVAWDQPLSGEPLSKWKGLIEALKESRPLQLPRHYSNGLPVDSTNKIQLYGFCAALNAAYAAVVYVVDNSKDQKTYYVKNQSVSCESSDHCPPRIAVSTPIREVNHQCY